MQIDIDNLCFRYPGDSHDTLSGITCTIGSGELLALIGHNGSGKTTLVKHLNGLLQPLRGEIRLDGQSIAGKRVSWCAARVALSFQNPDDQICTRRVFDEVAFGPRNLGHSGYRLDELVRESMALFGLSGLAEVNPHDLGYSQRKRLAIASAVAMDTPVLVFDEPTAGLDSGESEQLAEALASLRKRGKTVIVITHDMDFIADQIAGVICLAHGRIAFAGSASELFSDRQILDECGLMQPQIFRLSHRLGHSPPVMTVQELITELLKQSEVPIGERHLRI